MEYPIIRIKKRTICTYKICTITQHPLLCFVCANCRFYNMNYVYNSLHGMTNFKTLNIFTWPCISSYSLSLSIRDCNFGFHKTGDFLELDERTFASKIGFLLWSNSLIMDLFYLKPSENLKSSVFSATWFQFPKLYTLARVVITFLQISEPKLTTFLTALYGVFVM